MFHELKQNSGWQKRDKWKASHCPLLLHGVRWEKEAEGRRGDGGSGPALSGVRFRWRRKQQMPLRPFNKTKTHAEASSIVLCGELIYIKYNWGQKRGRTKWDLCLPSLFETGQTCPTFLLRMYYWCELPAESSGKRRMHQECGLTIACIYNLLTF